MTKTALAPTLVLAAALVGCGSARSPIAPPAQDVLMFDAAGYQMRQLTVDGRSFAVRAYEGLPTVRQPVDARLQTINVYVPEGYFHGASVGGYTARTAPIFLPNQVGGYMPAPPGTAQPPAEGPGAGRASTIAVALSKGHVVASPGARGRTTADGKAPAAIVDLKAAVRWLRHNDARMPGDAEKIIANGTSAGGALSALLGASGNHPDYAAALAALGAAEARDDIFAVSAYCPITNLENADAAYEWQFRGITDYMAMKIDMVDFRVQRKLVPGALTAAQRAASEALAPAFAAYVNGLGLRGAQGEPLTLDAAGNGPFKDQVARHVLASAAQATAAGQLKDVPAWLRMHGEQVAGMDFGAYARAIGRVKAAPAFDGLALENPENQLFGSASVDKRHFTADAARRGAVAGAPLADAQTVKMMNAMRYIGDASARTAHYWRIRHGTDDRDTSLAVPVMLATRLANTGRRVDFALPWGRPHSGDYDLDELFAWMAQVSAAP